jgi:GNAT superfamily N-acetyltransferase
MSEQTVAELTIRPYRDEDEPAVLALLTRTLGGGPAGARPPEFFRWKHLENPFGRSSMILAEAEGAVVGFRSFLRWSLRSEAGDLRAARAVDTATHPDHQGRGIFSRLTRSAIEQLRGDTDLIFNTPNANSLPGYLKMGWSPVGTMPVRIRVRRPIPFLRSIRRLDGSETPVRERPHVEAEPAADAMADAGPLAALLAAEAPDRRIHTPRTVELLRWRYARAPLLGYHAIRSIGTTGGLQGLAIFRVRPRGPLWETTLSELFVPSGEGAIARRLLHEVVGAADVDHVTCAFPFDSEAGLAARRSFLPSPKGLTFVANPLQPGIVPDPTELRSWALSLGDLEVF